MTATPPQLGGVNLYAPRAMPYIPPQIPAPPPAAAVVAPAAVAVVSAPPLAVAGIVVGGLLTVATVWAYLDLKNAENSLQKAKENAARVNNRPVNSGGNKFSQAPPPFTGGQSAGVQYRVRIQVIDTITQQIETTEHILNGAIGYPFLKGNSALDVSAVSIVHGGVLTELYNKSHVPPRLKIHNFVILNRIDGLPDTGGNPPPTTAPTPINDGYTGDRSRDRDKFPPPQIPSSKPVNTVNNVTNNITNNVTNNTTVNTGAEPNTSTRIGLAPPPSAPTTTPPPVRTAPSAPREGDKKEEKKVSPTYIPPKENDDIRRDLTGMGAILARISTNTQPQNQRINAKNGSCDALNSPECREGLKNDIVNPINQNIDATKVQTAAILTNQGIQNATLANIVSFVSRIYNNQFVHSSLSFMSAMTNIHNAAMLSRDVAETLGTVVDNSVNLSGQKMKDTDGNDVGFTSWVGTNIRAIIVQIVGADKYVQLALQWQKANTIYHSAMGVVNITQSMLDPISGAVEYGMENVSKIGNGLREDGVVSENSYPAMDETIRARRVNRFERLSDTLEGAENVSSNLSSITSSAVSVKEDYRQLREDTKALKDKAAVYNEVDETARTELKASLPTAITPITLAPAPSEEEP